MKQNATRYVLAKQIDLWTFTGKRKHQQLGNMLQHLHT